MPDFFAAVSERGEKIFSFVFIIEEEEVGT